MSEKSVSPFVKQALELGPIILFFAAYMMLRDRTFMIAGVEREALVVVTALFIPTILFATGALWYLTGELSKMQTLTAVLVVVFGGLTLWLNDDRFFKMKPTLIYVIFGGVLGFGLLRGVSYLRYLMGEMIPLQQEGWMKLTRRMCLFFFGLAILNEIIWRSFSDLSWVYFKTFGLTAAIILFFVTQSGLFSKYATKEDD